MQSSAVLLLLPVLLGAVDSPATAQSDGVQESWVRHYASNLMPSSDCATAMSIDGSGNIYVTGSVVSAEGGSDFLTIKYDSSGTIQWQARYDGPGDGEDFPAALAVDATGHVYVTGESEGDYVTVKYDGSGIQEWVARYNGPGDSEDMPAALVVDAEGNVYVTGRSAEDYVTVKYTNSGTQEWIARYDGPVYSSEPAVAVAIDGSGCLYVTGWSDGSTPGGDYATVKYSRSGTQEWVARYNGPGNNEDRPVAIAVDTSGNVYVTGESDGGATGSDYATVKYNSSGTQEWVARYNGPASGGDGASAVTVDASGNVFVTGGSDDPATGSDYATVKYNSSGTQEWVARYHGGSYSADFARALAVDAAGNVYVTGESYGGATGMDYATVKYTSSGVQEWVARYNGPDDSDDSPVALAVDAWGNVYVTGKSEGETNEDLTRDYATVKYTSSGVQEWVARYHGPGDRRGCPVALAVDAWGNVYVTGNCWVGLHDDYATVKYTSSGAEEWVASYNGPSNSRDIPVALGVDAAGNVYVTGESYGGAAGIDYATVKYTGSGTEEWVARYNGPDDRNDSPVALAVDASGNVYVTGVSSFPIPGAGDYCYCTVKYTSSGTQEWVARDTGPATTRILASPCAIAVDASGNVYVTGRSQGDYVTVKHTSSGTQEWVARYDGPANGDDTPVGIAVDGWGGVYVTGICDQKWEFGDPGCWVDGHLATIRYDKNGEVLWMTPYKGLAERLEATGLALDSSGNVYVTGTSESGPAHMYTTIKYEQTATSVESMNTGAPDMYVLSQNCPNPFNPSTTIRYELPKSSIVRLSVYDMLGREVSVLVDERRDAGNYEATFDAEGLASGVYLYRLTAGSFVQTRKMLIVK